MNVADMVGVALWSSKTAQRTDELATLTGERDAARARVAELEATVAGLEARLNQAINDRMFYYQLFQDAQKGV